MTEFSANEKVQMLGELIAGAPDCFALRSATRIVDLERWGPIYTPMSDKTLMWHLKGHLEVGTYAMIPEQPWPLVRWVCADFDGKRPGADWKRDVRRAVEFLMEFEGCPCFVNLSRSGEGAHVRMLFREPVPAWMARRWMTAWLTEAEVMRDDEHELLGQSFDRLIPPQDTLSNEMTAEGYRRPGNLAGAPLNGRIARHSGGTMPLDTERVAMGDFTPDGRHWDHVRQALEEREWGERELKAALDDCPGDVDKRSPQALATRSLPIIKGTAPVLAFTQSFCEFFRYMRTTNKQPYALWMALATQLHRFGDEGYATFHQISALDSRYNPSDTDKKWEQTADMSPVRCDTLSDRMGWTCPLLKHPGCNGAKAPTFFYDVTDAELL